MPNGSPPSGRPDGLLAPAELETLAPVITGDRFDLLKIGRIEQAHRCGGAITPEEADARHWLASNGRGGYLTHGAHFYERHLHEQVRRHGGTITRERQGWKDGRRVITRKTHHYRHALLGASTAPSRSAPRQRGAGRPRARAVSRSSGRSGDSGDGPGEPEPPLEPVPTAPGAWGPRGIALAARRKERRWMRARFRGQG